MGPIGQVNKQAISLPARISFTSLWDTPEWHHMTYNILDIRIKGVAPCAISGWIAASMVEK